MFKKSTKTKKKKIETPQLIESKFLSDICGGQGQSLQTAIASDEIKEPLMLSVGVTGTHQPPP